MNLILWGVNLKTENFPYATTEFSFSMLTCYMNSVLFLTAVFASIITSDEFKFRTINNSIAFGISRIKIFISKLIVALLTSIPALIIIEGVLIGSAYLLLENNSSTALTDVFTATAASIPSLIAGLTAAISLYFLIGNMAACIWSWIGTIVVFPIITSLLGIKFKFFEWLNSWLIYQLLASPEIDENMNFIYTWSSSAGMQKCLTAGLLGTIVFFIIGILGFRKKDM